MDLPDTRSERCSREERRVESALDPAPAEMVETYVALEPKERWRPYTSRDIWDEINRVATRRV